MDCFSYRYHHRDNGVYGMRINMGQLQFQCNSETIKNYSRNTVFIFGYSDIDTQITINL